MPTQVRWALRIAWTSFLIGSATALWGAFARDRPMAATSLFGMFADSFFSLLITAATLVAVARRAQWGRWLLLAMTGLGVLSFASQAMPAIYAAYLVANFAAVALLFTPASTEWFTGASSNNRWRGP